MHCVQSADTLPTAIDCLDRLHNIWKLIFNWMNGILHDITTTNTSPPAITAVPLSLGIGQRKLWEKQQQPEMPVWRDPVWLIDRAIDPYLAQVISDQNVLGSDISIIRLFDNIERVKGALKNGVKVKDVRVCVLSFLWFLWIRWMLSPHHKGCERTMEEVDDIRTELLLYPFQYYVCCFIRDSLRCTKRNERRNNTRNFTRVDRPKAYTIIRLRNICMDM